MLYKNDDKTEYKRNKTKERETDHVILYVLKSIIEMNSQNIQYVLCSLGLKR